MSHYFDEAPAAPSRPATVQLVLADLKVALGVDRGVFSSRGVDPGTIELLRAGGPGGAAHTPPVGGDLLDLGCGYGPIACALALRDPSATVWAVDVNRRAVALTAANAASLGLANVRAVTPDEVPGDVRFRAIWSNPPIRIGKAALQEILGIWLPRLEPTGRAWLVVHKHLGSDSLASWLAAEGWSVERAASRKGYRILSVGHR